MGRNGGKWREDNGINERIGDIEIGASDRHRIDFEGYKEDDVWLGNI